MTISLTWCPWVQKLVPYTYINFIWMSPYIVSRVFSHTFSIFLKTVWYKLISALPKAGHCFANEVQILCSSETSKYENLPQVANIQKNTCACEHWWKRVSWFWEILHTWVVLPSFVLVCLILFCFTFFQNFVFERSSKCTCI